MSLGFFFVFWYHNDLVTNGTKMVHNREGNERCPVFMGPILGPFCVLFLD